MIAFLFYLALLGLASAYALRDWRRAWYALIICGVLQYPVRKLTPGQPVAVSFLVVGLFGVLLFAARRELLAHEKELGRRFPRLNTAMFGRAPVSETQPSRALQPASLPVTS